MTESTTPIQQHVSETDPHSEYIQKSEYQADGDILVGSGVGAFSRLEKGETNRVLGIVNNVIQWMAHPLSFIADKGDLILGRGNQSYSRLAVGSNGQVLVADSSQPMGVRWATPVIVAPFIEDRQTGANITTLTIGMTVPEKTHQIGFVSVSEWTGGASQISGVTWGGVAMTKVREEVNTGVVTLWVLVDPPWGATNVVISGSGDRTASCWVLSGTNSYDHFGDDDNNVDVTALDSDMLLRFDAHLSGDTSTPDAAQRNTVVVSAGNSESDSGSQLGTNGTVTCSWTVTPDTRGSCIAVAVHGLGLV